MGAETKITVSLPTDLVADLEAAVAAGDHASLDAAIVAAVEELQYRRIEAAIGIDRLRELIQEGIDSGPSVDGEAVFARLIAKYEAMPEPKR